MSFFDVFKVPQTEGTNQDIVRRLAYVRPVERLSGSGFRLYEEDPLAFFVKYCGAVGDRPEREPQGQAAACGIAFDSAVSGMLENKAPDFSQIEEYNKGQISVGDSLARQYVDCGAGLFLTSMGQMVGTQIDNGIISVPGTDVKIMGYVDYGVDTDFYGPIPVDFKVRGGGTPMGARSPYKGYCRRWINGTLDHPKRQHKSFPLPMNEIQDRWADQLTTYSWLLGSGMEASPAGIDEVLFHKGEVQIIQYRAWLTAEWKEKLRDRMVAAWDAIQSESIIDLSLDPKLVRSLI